MAENSKIEWCEHTFNPWMGCTRVSLACDNCYAAVSTPARAMGIAWGAGEKRIPTADANWKLPLRWDARAAAAGVRARVFCASLADVFDNEVPPEWRTRLFEHIRATPNLDWLLLTKRIGNAEKMAAAAGGWPENVWLGATVVNQEEADRDVPKLLSTKVRAGIRVAFLSIEPMLGQIDLTKVRGRVWTANALDQSARWLHHDGMGFLDPTENPLSRGYQLDWVIVGGESGQKARPMHPAWAMAIRDQCAAAGVPFLFKQWGEWAPANQVSDEHEDAVERAYFGCFVNGEWSGACSTEWAHAHRPVIVRVGKKATGRLLDGVQHDGVPQQ